MGTSQLAGNPYLNFTHFAFEKFGRKIPYVLSMGLAGISLLGVLFIPKCNKILMK